MCAYSRVKPGNPSPSKESFEEGWMRGSSPRMTRVAFVTAPALQRTAPRRATRLALRPGTETSMRQNRQQQQRHDVGDLDHRVHGRTRGVLVGIADGVAGHRGLVGVGALAAVMAVLDVFLGVIP